MQLDLASLLGIARRWWWIVFLSCLIGGISAYAVSHAQERLYTADATLLVDPAVNSPADYGSVQAGQNLVETYRTWAVSRPVLESASRQLSLSGGPGDFFWSQVSAETVPGTLFIQVSATDPNPAHAAEIANAVANAFVEDIRTQAQTQTAMARARVEDRLDDITGQINGMNASIESLQASQQPLSGADQSRLDSLLESRTQLEEEHLQLQSTAASLALRATTSGVHVSMSAPAIAPVSPSSPRIMRSTLVGLSVGLLVAAAAIILLEYFDTRIRTPEELKAVTAVPVLATVGQIPKSTRSHRQLFTVDTPASRAAESMRMLRENLQFASAPAPFTTLAIMSPDTTEGKSTLVANLGVVMARAELKTLIIDADLRRPTQHRLFGVSNDAGLSSFLTREFDDWSAIAVRLNVPGLFLIPSGPVPPNPADLLQLGRMNHLLRSSAKEFDIVLIDTSPTLVASDALSVASRADASVVVCRLGETQRDQLSQALAAVENVAPRLLGLVLNDHKDAAGSLRYDQSYRSSTWRRLIPRYGGADRSTPPRFTPRQSPQLLKVSTDIDTES